ncbi:MAG TPA: fibronectin type III domain-containing protein, partial [Solirubrobacteraceae bacterium]
TVPADSGAFFAAYSDGPSALGGPPSAETGAASAIADDGASLAGVIDGAATAFAFEYGPSESFGALSAVDSAGSGSGSQAVALPIAGLAPGTTYRYRIVATNADGTAAGAVRSFTTPSAT